MMRTVVIRAESPRGRHVVSMVIASGITGLAPLFLTSLSVSAEGGAQIPPAVHRARSSTLNDRLIAVSGEKFQVRESDHFAICFDTDYAIVRSLIGRLEGTYDAIRRFCRAGSFRAGEPSERLGVILFDRHDDFARYAKEEGLSMESAAGFYSQRTNLSAFFNTLNGPQLRAVARQIERAENRLKRLGGFGSPGRGPSGDRRALVRELTALRTQRDVFVRTYNRIVIQHEAAHQLLFHFGVHVRGAANPLWFVEGLACQFEVPQPDARGQLPQVNHERLADFRDGLGVSPGDKSVSDAGYLEAVRTGRWVPLRDFVSRPELFSGHDERIAFRYAQAWALVYYLQAKREKDFDSFGSLLAKRRPGDSASGRVELDVFESAFGRADEELERSWLETMLDLRLDRREAGR